MPPTLRTVLALSLFAAACDRAPRNDSAAPPAAAATSTAPPIASSPPSASAPPTQTLADARRGFTTTLEGDPVGDGPPPAPPAAIFTLVRYASPVGRLAAYVSPRPASPGRKPAIIWLGGGMSNGIGRTWTPSPRENDQSARAFREAGIILMRPSLRGGNDNPGKRGLYFGEVDDVLAAAEYLATLDYVDTGRIYLGGHSTGGTLALLVAESTERFRAVFSFGPIADIRAYGDEVPLDGMDPKEVTFRSPVSFVTAIRTPTFLIEGSKSPNAAAVRLLGEKAGAAPVHAHVVEGRGHFDTLAPITPLLAAKILADDGPTTKLTITDAELAAAR